MTEKPIEVLLVSPRLPSTDPGYGGDHAYTDTLLACPPHNVRYHHYEDLAARGQIRTPWFLNAFASRLPIYGLVPPDFWAVYLASDFVPDLVHVNGFSAYLSFPKRRESSIPLILGQSTGGASDLLCYLGWEEKRARRARQVEAWILRLLRIYNSSLNPRHAHRILVWSEFARQMHLWDGLVKSEQVEVLYPGLSEPAYERRRRPREGITFLFVGRDFRRKNGHLVLEAFRRLRKTHPTARLLAIGNLPPGETIAEECIVHQPVVTREKLYAEIYPQADVLLLPSRAEGFGLVLLEAMSFGIPTIGVDAWAMPELIEDGENGFLIPQDSVEALADRMGRLAIDRDLVEGMGKASKRIFRTRFSVGEHNRRLRAVYVEALAKRG